jgi:hypothetical protein
MVPIFPKAENEPEPEEEVKEEEDEDEEEDDDGQSGRLRFKTERKDVTSGIVRLADAANKRRNIPETLGTFNYNLALRKLLIQMSIYFCFVFVNCNK